MSGIAFNVGSLQRVVRALSMSRRLGASVFDGVTSAYSLRIPANSTYSGPLIRVRRAVDNAESNFSAFVTTDSNGNRWLDTTSLLAFANPTSLVNGGAYITNTGATLAAAGISALNFVFGGSSGLDTVVSASNAVFPITTNNSYWFGGYNGQYTKAILLSFSFSGGNVTVSIADARYTTGDFRSSIASAGTWAASTISTSDTVSGYGAKSLSINIPTNCFVTTWYNQNGGTNLTQTTAANQPRIVTVGVVDTDGGKPSIVFSGGQWMLGGTYPTATLQLCAVIRRPANTYANYAAVLGAATSWNGFTVRWWGQMASLFGVDAYASDINTNTGVPIVARWRNGAGVPEFSVNGTITGLGSAASTGTTPLNQIQIGRWNYTDAFVGSMQEIVLHADTLPSLTASKSIERNQGAAFRITVA